MTFSRKLLSCEKSLFVEHLQRLDDHDRQLRFGGFTSDEAIGRYVHGINFARDVVVGSFDHDLVLRGASHIAFHGRTAEIGLSVEKSFRGKGVGSALLDRSINLATIRRATIFASQCLAHNGWMKRAVQARGFKMRLEEDTAFATASLPSPTPFLTFRVVATEQMGWAAQTAILAIQAATLLIPA